MKVEIGQGQLRAVNDDKETIGAEDFRVSAFERKLSTILLFLIFLLLLLLLLLLLPLLLLLFLLLLLHFLPVSLGAWMSILREIENNKNSGRSNENTMSLVFRGPSRR